MVKPLKVLGLGVSAVVILNTTGCTALMTYINHRNLDTHSKMSNSIFLDPTVENKKTVYVQVRNTTDKEVELKDDLVKDLKAHGWMISKDPKKAYNMVQVNVLSVSPVANENAAWNALSSGFGGAIAGGAIGAAVGGYAGLGYGAGIGVLAGYGGDYLLSSFVKSVTYAMVTDVQISIKTKGVKQSQQANLKQGTGNELKQEVSGSSDWLRYRTRIASTANKVNLDFKDAQPVLSEQIAKEVAGILGD